MAQATFEKLYKGLLVRSPDLLVPLAQEYIKYAYRKALNACEWGATRRQAEWTIPASYTTGTVTVTQDSTTVTGSGTTWTTASHGGLQFKVGNGPYYTVSLVNSTTSLTLDRAYAGTTSSGAAYSISRVYVTPSSDFKSVVGVLDPENRWKLWLGYSQEFADARDPQRSRTGPPTHLLSGTYNDSGVPRFELWPRPTASGYLTYKYYRNTPDLSDDTDTIIFPFTEELIMSGAISELARHPGTAEKPNPYFDIRIAGEAGAEFQRCLGYAMRMDQSVYNSDFWKVEEEIPYAPTRDLDYLREHDPLVW